jgi:hypothetical protein
MVLRFFLVLADVVVVVVEDDFFLAGVCLTVDVLAVEDLAGAVLF